VGLYRKPIFRLKGEKMENQEFRYQPEPAGAFKLLREIIAQHFPDLQAAQIMILQDTKEKKNKGAIVFARIAKATDLTKALTRSRKSGSADYIIFHELRHTSVLRIFNEETNRGAGEVIVIYKRQEVKTIIEALEAAVKAKPRKRSWKDLLNKLEKRAYVY